MKNMARSWLGVLLAVGLAWAGCDGGGGGQEDAGQDGLADGDGGDEGGADQAAFCLNDYDCVAPEVCLEHVCQVQVVDPDANRVLGRFTAIVNDSRNESNTALVRGKLDGKGFYMEWGYAEVSGLGDVEIFLYGILTNDLYNFLIITVPRQSPTGQAIEIGPTKVSRAMLDRVTFNANGQVVDQVTLATAASGQIDFSSFGTATGSRLEANFSIELEALP